MTPVTPARLVLLAQMVLTVTRVPLARLVLKVRSALPVLTVPTARLARKVRKVTPVMLAPRVRPVQMVLTGRQDLRVPKGRRVSQVLTAQMVRSVRPRMRSPYRTATPVRNRTGWLLLSVRLVLMVQMERPDHKDRQAQTGLQVLRVQTAQMALMVPTEQQVTAHTTLP